MRAELIETGLPRLLATLEMIPDSYRGKDILELGSSPYFLSLCLYRMCSGTLQARQLLRSRRQARRRPPGQPAHRRGDRLSPTRHSTSRPTVSRTPDESFDVVVFSELIEHLGVNPVRALAEIHRVLRPGGIVDRDDAQLALAGALRHFPARRQPDGGPLFPAVRLRRAAQPRVPPARAARAAGGHAASRSRRWSTRDICRARARRALPARRLAAAAGASTATRRATSTSSCAPGAASAFAGTSRPISSTTSSSTPWCNTLGRDGHQRQHPVRGRLVRARARRDGVELRWIAGEEGQGFLKTPDDLRRLRRRGAGARAARRARRARARRRLGSLARTGARPRTSTSTPRRPSRAAAGNASSLPIGDRRPRPGDEVEVKIQPARRASADRAWPCADSGTSKKTYTDSTEGCGLPGSETEDLRDQRSTPRFL